MVGRISIPARRSGVGIGTVGANAANLKGGNISIPDLQLRSPIGYDQRVKDAAVGFAHLAKGTDTLAETFTRAEGVRQDGVILNMATSITQFSQDNVASWDSQYLSDGVTPNTERAIGTNADLEWFKSQEKNSASEFKRVTESPEYQKLEPANQLAVRAQLASTLTALRGKAAIHMVAQANVAKEDAITTATHQATQSVLSDPLDQAHQRRFVSSMENMAKHKGIPLKDYKDNIQEAWTKVVNSAFTSALQSNEAGSVAKAKNILKTMGSVVTSDGEKVFIEQAALDTMRHDLAKNTEDEVVLDMAKEMHGIHGIDTNAAMDRMDEDNVPAARRAAVVAEMQKRIDRQSKTYEERHKVIYERATRNAYGGGKLLTSVRHEFSGTELKAIDAIYELGISQRHRHTISTNESVRKDWYSKSTTDKANMTIAEFKANYLNTLKDDDYVSAVNDYNAARATLGRQALASHERAVKADTAQAKLNRQMYQKVLPQVLIELGADENDPLKDPKFARTIINLQASLEARLQAGAMSVAEFYTWRVDMTKTIGDELVVDFRHPVHMGDTKLGDLEKKAVALMPRGQEELYSRAFLANHKLKHAGKDKKSDPVEIEKGDLARFLDQFTKAIGTLNFKSRTAGTHYVMQNEWMERQIEITERALKANNTVVNSRTLEGGLRTRALHNPKLMAELIKNAAPN